MKEFPPHYCALAVGFTIEIVQKLVTFRSRNIAINGASPNELPIPIPITLQDADERAQVLWEDEDGDQRREDGAHEEEDGEHGDKGLLPLGMCSRTRRCGSGRRNLGRMRWGATGGCHARLTWSPAYRAEHHRSKQGRGDDADVVVGYYVCDTV